MSKSLKMIIEALLFSSDKPLTVKEIHDCLPDAEKSEIRNSIKVLAHDYDALERSFVLKEVAGGYQFRSRPEYGSYILRMMQKTPNRLTRATIETLAIIAYKQPIMRSEVERLRGVDVGGIIRTLMEKGLVKIMGRKELPGRPLIYGTTKRFLEVFDLKDLKSLPRLKEIKDFAADQYEPTVVNSDAEGGEVSPEEVGTEEAVAPPVEHTEDTQEAAGPSNEEQAEVTESEAGNTAESEADTNTEGSKQAESEVDVTSEDNRTPEAENDPGADSEAEEESVPEPGPDTEPDAFESSEIPEDTPEEDEPVKTQDIPSPEESAEPEENGTET